MTTTVHTVASDQRVSVVGTRTWWHGGKMIRLFSGYVPRPVPTSALGGCAPKAAACRLFPDVTHGGSVRTAAIAVTAAEEGMGTPAKDLPAGIGTVGVTTCAARITRRRNRLNGVRASVNLATEHGCIPYADGITDCSPQTWPTRVEENA